MTQPSFITVILVGLVSLIAFESILYWHRKTKGSWRLWPAGRSLMYLLIIIAVGFGYGVVNQFLGDYPARPWIGFGLYVLFILALIVIRVTIQAEMRAGKKRLHQRNHTHTGPLNVVVASNNEETPNE